MVEEGTEVTMEDVMVTTGLPAASTSATDLMLSAMVPTTTTRSGTIPIPTGTATLITTVTVTVLTIVAIATTAYLGDIRVTVTMEEATRLA